MRRLLITIAIVAVFALGATACSSGDKKAATNARPAESPPTSPAPTTTSSPSSVPKTSTTASGPNLAAVNVGLTRVASGLSSPVDVAWRKGDARMYVAEQTGRVSIVDTNGQRVATPVLTLAVSHGNEQGLLGLTFSPDGTKLYVDYTDPSGDIHVIEYTMQGDRAASPRELLFQNHHQFPNHNGGEVMTGPDGMLYITIGDGGGGGDPNGNGQNLNTLLGKILRINPAPSGSAPYTIPADNPFAGQAGKRGEIWMYGLRNPWRFSFDRANRDVWMGDVGQNLYEEIDYAPARKSGINWGWNRREGKHTYKGSRPANAQDPIIETTHADGNCAIIGGYVYRGNTIPGLNGVYLYSDNCKPTVVGAVRDGNSISAQRDLTNVPNITSFGEDPNGELYAVSRGGVIYKFTAA
jgi:glucose/arabinose dehydrogenase